MRSVFKINHLPLSMHLNGEIAILDNQKARLFNEYIYFIYLSPTTLPTPDQLPSSPINTPCISSIAISEEDIHKALSSLDPNKLRPRVLTILVLCYLSNALQLWLPPYTTYLRPPSQWRNISSLLFLNQETAHLLTTTAQSRFFQLSQRSSKD